MQALTLEGFAGNAFRTLGVSARASQQEIDSAARRLRIWPDAARIPPTPWDLPWLGPVRRSRSDIEHAVARLRDPIARLGERLRWYHAATAPSREPALSKQPPPPASGHYSSLDHDAALCKLHAALLAPPEADTRSNWRAALERFSLLVSDPEAADWIGAAEEAAEFDKQATPWEIQAAVRELLEQTAAGLAERVHSLALTGHAALAAQLAQLLNEPRCAAHCAAAMPALLDRLEDALKACCAQIDGHLRETLRTNHDQPVPFYPDNLAVTEPAAREFAKKVRPLADLLIGLTANDPDRCLRSRAEAAELLALVALGWEWSGRFMAAETALVEALKLAADWNGAEPIKTALARVTPVAERERKLARAKEQPVVSSDVLPALRPRPSPPLPRPATPSSAKNRRKPQARLSSGDYSFLKRAGVGIFLSAILFIIHVTSSFYNQIQHPPIPDEPLIKPRAPWYEAPPLPIVQPPVVVPQQPRDVFEEVFDKLPATPAPATAPRPFAGETNHE